MRREPAGELIAHARYYDGPSGTRTSAGGAFLFFSETTGSGGAFVASDADVLLHGASAYAYLGDETGAGDFDGDGNLDLVAGGEGISSYAGWVGVFRSQGF